MWTALALAGRLGKIGTVIGHIFLYGTMLPHLARGRSGLLAASLGEGRAATVHGRLYAVVCPEGAYPVLRSDESGAVVGQVHEIPRKPGWLARLDRYEAYDPANELASDYLRREVTALLADGSLLRVQAYIGRESGVQGLAPIAHGDFPRFLAETRLRPYTA